VSSIVFKSMAVTALRDRISLFYAVIFPLVLLIGLGMYMGSDSYMPRLTTAVTALGIVFWALQGIAFQILSQRSRGVYKLLHLTPYPVIRFILSMSLARTALSLIMSVLVLTAGVLVLGVPMGLKAWFLLLPVLLAGTLCFTCLGFVIANVANNEGQINMYSNLLCIPLVFCTEAFYNLDVGPEWIRYVGEWLPFSHMVQAMNLAMEGAGRAYLTELLILAVFTAASAGLAAVTFRKSA
jgi:ABC-2 type transport system permease protein